MSRKFRRLMKRAAGFILSLRRTMRHSVICSAENSTARRTLEKITPDAQKGWHNYNISPNARWAFHNYSVIRRLRRILKLLI